MGWIGGGGYSNYGELHVSAERALLGHARSHHRFSSRAQQLLGEHSQIHLLLFGRSSCNKSSLCIIHKGVGRIFPTVRVFKEGLHRRAPCDFSQNPEVWERSSILFFFRFIGQNIRILLSAWLKYASADTN